MFEVVLLLVFLTGSSFILGGINEDRTNTIGSNYKWDPRMNSEDLNRLNKDLWREQRYATAKARTLELQYMGG